MSEIENARKKLFDTVRGIGEIVLDPIMFHTSTYGIDLTRILNQLNVAYDNEDLKKFCKNVIDRDVYPIIPSYEFSTIGKIQYLRDAGAYIDDALEDIYNRILTSIQSRYKAPEKKVEAKKVGNSLIESLEGYVDDILGGDNPPCNFTRRRDEIDEAKEHFGRQLEDMRNHPEDYKEETVKVIDGIVKYLAGEKRTVIRKVVQRKKVTKLTTKYLRFMPRSEELDVSSIVPSKIPGSDRVYIYNVKTRKIILFSGHVSINRRKLVADSVSSHTVRKPEQFVKRIAEVGKREALSMFNEIRGKVTKASGLLNEDCLILHIDQ